MTLEEYAKLANAAILDAMCLQCSNIRCPYCDGIEACVDSSRKPCAVHRRLLQVAESFKKLEMKNDEIPKDGSRPMAQGVAGASSA